MLKQSGMAYLTLVLAICTSVSHSFPPKNRFWLTVLSIFISSITYSKITPVKQSHLLNFLSYFIGLTSLSNISEQGNVDFFKIAIRNG